jgi:hypothetical protein
MWPSCRDSSSIAVLCSAVILQFQLLGPASGQLLQSPERSSATRKPPVVEDEPVKGEASLPEKLPLGFALDLDGTVLTEDWELTGSVIEMEQGKLSFRSGDTDKIGHLVYRLPQNLAMPLSGGDSFKIVRKKVVRDSRIGFELVIQSVQGEVILGAGRVFDSRPPEPPQGDARALLNTEVARGTPLSSLIFRAAKAPAKIDSRSAKIDVYDVPLRLLGGDNLNLNDVAEIAPQSEPVQLQMNGVTYRFGLLQSRLEVPKTEFKDVAESPGYSLEYVFVKSMP